MRNEQIDERDYKFMATLEPIAVLFSDDGELKRRMTDRVPKPETVVRQASDKREIKTGLKIPEDGVFLGHLSVGGEKVRTAAEPPTIDYRVKDDYDSGDPLVFRHSLVAGGTGSGKTHGAKNILRQYLSVGAHVSDGRRPKRPDGRRAVRPAGRVRPDARRQPNGERRVDERAWEREGIAHGGHDETVAFVPKVGGSTYAARPSRAPNRSSSRFRSRWSATTSGSSRVRASTTTSTAR